jgi:ribonuclease P protein component
LAATSAASLLDSARFGSYSLPSCSESGTSCRRVPAPGFSGPYHRLMGEHRETHLPTAQSQAQEEARLSRAHEDEGWTPRLEASSRQGQSPARRVVAPDGARRGDRDQGLGRRQRLHRTGEFQRVYREGTSYPGRFQVLFVLHAPELQRRAGFVAGRRVGNAVRRARSKRFMREAYRRLKSELPEAGLNLVLVARAGCAEAGGVAVATDLGALLRRAGLSPASSGSAEPGGR